jgi:hypothetical protein
MPIKWHAGICPPYLLGEAAVQVDPARQRLLVPQIGVTRGQTRTTALDDIAAGHSKIGLRGESEDGGALIEDGLEKGATYGVPAQRDGVGGETCMRLHRSTLCVKSKETAGRILRLRYRDGGPSR